jgi:hypothetical protein
VNHVMAPVHHSSLPRVFQFIREDVRAGSTGGTSDHSVETSPPRRPESSPIELTSLGNGIFERRDDDRGVGGCQFTPINKSTSNAPFMAMKVSSGRELMVAPPMAYVGARLDQVGCGRHAKGDSWVFRALFQGHICAPNTLDAS